MKNKKEIKNKKGKTATLLLMAAMFFNPMGYDVLFYKINEATGNYLTTVCIFYLLSALCFTLYFFLSNINPISYFVAGFRRFYDSIIKK